MNDNSISDENDLQMYWDDIMFNDNSYTVYFIIFTGREWSEPRYQNLKLTRVIFCLED